MYSLFLLTGFIIGCVIGFLVSKSIQLKNYLKTNEKPAIEHAITPDIALDLNEKEKNLLEELKKETNETLKRRAIEPNKSIEITYPMSEGSMTYRKDIEKHSEKIINELILIYETSGWKITKKQSTDYLGNVSNHLFFKPKENTVYRIELSDINRELDEELKSNKNMKAK